ncbi:MAG: hypothetical protein AAGF12_25795 [Myxococcota bacterium]
MSGVQRWWVLTLLAACGGASRDLPPLEVTLIDLGGGEDVARARPTPDPDRANLVAQHVRQRQEDDHGELPPVERLGELEEESWPLVSVVNDTPHRLMVWFAGPCPRTVALEPRGEYAAEFCEGNYEIAAELSANDFLPFVGDGDELENGFGYSLTFYVVAEPRSRTRIRRR